MTLPTESEGADEEGRVASENNEMNEGASGGVTGSHDHGTDVSLTPPLAPPSLTAPPAVPDQKNVLLPNTGEALVLSLNVLEVTHNH